MSKIDWNNLKEVGKLFALNLQVRGKNFAQYLQVIGSYYGRLTFAKCDARLTFSYLFDSPFKISSRFLLEKRECELHCYGETPLTTLDVIASECKLTAMDTVYELGCGRGRSCFWLREFIGCSVVGVDLVPEFIKRANGIAERCRLSRIEFRNEDMLKTDLSGATVVYLYGTCYSPELIHRLSQHLTSLPPGSKVITVSYPLSEYDPAAPFEIMNCFLGRFTWGDANVYLQMKT